MSVAEYTLENPIGAMEEYQKNGSSELRNQLVLHYSYIARMVAAQMRGVTATYAQTEDIVNQGIITLIDCVEKFKPAKGVKFESYAFMRIKCANIDFVRKQDWLPRRVRKAAKDISTAYDQLSNELMREPTTKEIAEHIGLSETAVNKHYSEISNSVMLSFETVLQSSLYGGDALPEKQVDEEYLPENRVLKVELRQQLAQAIDSLTDRERTVVSLYYYEHLKLFEIAEILKVSESRVCQTHSKAILKLQHKLEQYLKG